MVGDAKLAFCYDPDGRFIFPFYSPVWMTEMKTQNLNGMDFCQKQVSGIHFDLPGIKLKILPKSHWYDCFHQNNFCPHLSQTLAVWLPYTMYIDAKSARCWRYSPEDSQIQFPPGSTFQPNRHVVSTGLSFIISWCTRSKNHIPILMENDKNHQFMLRMGRIGFSSLDVLDRAEANYHIRSLHELTKALIATDESYNVCFFLHSTILGQSGDEFLQIVYGNESSIIQ